MIASSAGPLGRVLAAAALVVAAAAAHAADASAPIVVFRNASEGYHTFRIPALAALPSGTLVALAEGRARLGFVPPGGDTTDCYGVGASAADWRCTNKDVVVKRSLDGGVSWGAARAIAEANETHFYTNPQALVFHSRLFIEFMRCRVPRPAGGNAFLNCTAVLAASDDDGASFTGFRDVAPEQPSAGGFGGVVTASGRLVFSAPGAGATGALLSDDGGQTWRWGRPPAHAGENEVAEAAPGGDLLMTVRRKNNTRALFRSADGGESWDAGAVMAVTDPDCEASMIAVRSSAAPFLLFANPHTSGLLPYALGRQNVTVQRSTDGGASWTPILLVVEGPSAYTSLAQLTPAGAGAGSCGVLYEESQDLPVDFRSIRLLTFDCATGEPSRRRGPGRAVGL